ncbi:hypothetical protein M1403_00095 [Patescibacteria group bacterium]|nr:hypothetical protein [Patescibacteria group bacterium]
MFPESPIEIPPGKRIVGFLDGSYWFVDEDECRGCLMQTRKNEMPEHMVPVFEDRDVMVVQDAEFPVPGFYVIAPKAHIRSISDFSPELAMKMGLVTSLTRKGMRDELGIEFAEIYHEERIKNSHYHHWILPCWDYALRRSGSIPTIFPSREQGYNHLSPNIVNYLRSFSFEEENKKILEFNTKMQNYFKDSKRTNLLF